QALIQAQNQLKAENDQNKQRIKDLMDQIAAGKGTTAPGGMTPPPTTPGGTTAPPNTPTMPGGSATPPPIRWNGDITYRVDDTNFKSIQTGVIPPGDRGTVRERFRFNLISPLRNRTEAGMQLTTGEGNPGSPTSAFIAAGDAFRGKELRFGRAYFAYHFGDHPDTPIKGDANNDAALFFGKMPNPFWRGEAGAFASEMIWDNDVNPDGVALRVPLTKRGAKIGVTDTLAYYTLFQTANQAFDGITTNTWGIVNQAKVDAGWIKGAAQYLHYDNLNAGLHIPSFTEGLGTTAQSNVDANGDALIDPNAGVNAFLLRPTLGLQTTNNHASFGGGANGFLSDHFDILNLTGQILPRLSSRQVQPWLTVDWAHNFAVPLDHNGYGVTLGVGHDPKGNDVTIGGPTSAGQWSAWLTYRDVDADATLGTFADSDIGAGTGYRGGEVGLNYRLRSDLAGQILFINFNGFPRKTYNIQRIFIDIMKNF
ncbi:MAG: putative porin, partial [Armatimonadota bacterium]|nr:putative porin [Armatimonadota bacterium]